MRNGKGFTLVEILVVTAILSVIGVIIFPFFTSFQDQSLSVLNKNDLQDQAQRVMNYLAEEIREAGFLVSSIPLYADDTSFDNGAISPGSSIVPAEGADNDSLTLVKGQSWFPPLSLANAAAAGATTVFLNRDAASEIIGQNGAAVLNNIIFENQKKIYRVIGVNAAQLTLGQGLAEPASRGTEVLLARAHRFGVDDNDNLIYEDFEHGNEVLASSVDGLQFQYQLKDKDGFHDPTSPGFDPDEIRGVKIHLLVRSERVEKNYTNSEKYTLGAKEYVPFDDSFRRVNLERLVEVKNYAFK